nr:hypothetical protein [Tanacetum cinerariifolium]
MIQTLEDIMRASVIDFSGSYHLSIRCAPFEALYGTKCMSHVLWAEIEESSLTGLECKPLEFEVGDHVLLKVMPCKGVLCFLKKGKLAPRSVESFEILERIGSIACRLRLPEELSSVHDTFHVSNLKKKITNKVVLIKEKLKSVSDRQKSYADNRRKPLEFEVGDCMLLKVSPWKGVIRFVKRGKLALRYVGPFKILERIGPVAYRLRLPKELSSVHDTFHVSNLKKCLADTSLHVPLHEIKIDKTLRFVKESLKIMDCEVRSLKNSKISLVKVRWNSKRGPDFTWEREDHMKSKYPQLFVDSTAESAS